MKFKSPTPHLWAAILASLLTVTLALSLPARALAQSGAQSGSLNATDIRFLFIAVLAIASGVFVLVIALLLFAIIRYRRRADDEMPQQIHGNNKLELSWTVGSALIVLVLFFFTLGFYQLPRSAPAETMAVDVTGYTWYWDFFYPETSVRSENRLRVPAGTPILLRIASADVQHSFWVPALAGKVDAIPGRVQQLWFQVDEPGVYVGQCAEYCGREHYAMLITVEVMEPDAYAAWVDEQMAAIEAAAAAAEENLVGNPTSGQTLYVSLGCSACHALDGSRLVGPSFQGLGARAATSVEGLSAEEYLRQSILEPGAHVVEGYPEVMPINFGDRTTPQDLADLVAFLLQQ